MAPVQPSRHSRLPGSLPSLSPIFAPSSFGCDPWDQHAKQRTILSPRLMTNPQSCALGKQTIHKSKKRQAERAGGRERRKGEEVRSRGTKKMTTMTAVGGWPRKVPSRKGTKWRSFLARYVCVGSGHSKSPWAPLPGGGLCHPLSLSPGSLQVFPNQLPGFGLTLLSLLSVQQPSAPVQT